MSANSHQVGGKHYGGGDYQHWDWVCDIKLHYLPACATKYVSRHRSKNGVEDLEKTLHYIQKAEELNILGNSTSDRMAAFWRFVLENQLSIPEAIACWYLMEGEWEAARLVVQELLSQTA